MYSQFSEKNLFNEKDFCFQTSIHIYFAYLGACLFVYNKRQNGWTDWSQILCDTSHDPRYSEFQEVVSKFFDFCKILKLQKNKIVNPQNLLLCCITEKIVKYWATIKSWNRRYVLICFLTVSLKTLTPSLSKFKYLSPMLAARLEKRFKIIVFNNLMFLFTVSIFARITQKLICIIWITYLYKFKIVLLGQINISSNQPKLKFVHKNLNGIYSVFFCSI